MTGTPLLMSVHLPKTAGTSFATALQAAFGDGYRGDYAHPPMQRTPWRRRLHAVRAGLAERGRVPAGLACVHGHVLPLQYRIALGDRPVHWVTWLRDPVERLLSHYTFWRRDYAGDDPAQPLRNRMLAEDWSLERFALGPELRDVYRAYLWGFDPARFDFIGITEHYADDLARFAGRYLPPGHAPVAAHALGNPERQDRYDLDPGLRRRIEAYHARDVALYRWALRRRADG